MARFVHGTYGTYASGCRCERCAAYQKTRVARNRANRKSAGRLAHGTRSAYDCGCRCAPCKAARQEAYRRLEVPA